jgi:hypothetical protein
MKSAYFRSFVQIPQSMLIRNRDLRRSQSREYNRKRRKMIQEGIPFIPKSSHRSMKPGQLLNEATGASHSILLDEATGASHSILLDEATDPFPSNFPQHQLDTAAKPSSNSSQQGVDARDSIQEAMEEIWARDELECTQRAAAGAVLPDAQDQAKTLSKLEEWDAAVKLSTAMTTSAATFQERYWEKRVRSLETMGQVWRSKWAGIQYWDEKRGPYLSGTMGLEEGQEYLSHVQFGRDLLDGCRLVFSPEQVDPPEDVAKVVYLFRRVMSLSIEVSLGLERLSFSKQ